ncbi:MAG TPA: ferritin-like domain-containing protein [Vicinamibacterales bacterium]|nr:ferritin-like domain-containing protein [Vicinamibacterales bacterium]
MPTIDSLTTMLVSEVRDLYDAEKRLTTALPRMAKKATNRELRTALTDHLRETKGQVRRLEQVFRRLGETPRGKACLGMRGIVEEGNEHLKEDFERDDLRDAMIIGSSMKVEHYEMASYMGAISHARMLGQSEVQDLLQENLREEEAADKKLRAIEKAVINMRGPADSTEDAASGITGMIQRTFGANGKANGRASSRKGGSQKRSSGRRSR